MKRSSSPLRPADIERLSKNIIFSFLEHAVREGQIDPKGKSEAELVEALKHYDSMTANRNLVWATDHTSDILSKARAYRKSGDIWSACLFYATWFEHHFNFMLRSFGARRGLSDSAIRQIIRGTQTPAKIAIWPLFGVRPIAKRHQAILVKLAELRNYFVHYKWNYSADKGMDHQEKEAQVILSEMEKTVSYVRRYDNDLLLSGSKARLNRVVNLATTSEESKSFYRVLALIGKADS